MTTRSEWLALAERFQCTTSPDRQLDAELAFNLYAVPVGIHPIDQGPLGYVHACDRKPWSLGIRFPGKDEEWCKGARAYIDSETICIRRDGAVVIMNPLRVPAFTASIDAAIAALPEGRFWSVSGTPDRKWFHAILDNNAKAIRAGSAASAVCAANCLARLRCWRNDD